MAKEGPDRQVTGSAFDRGGGRRGSLPPSRPGVLDDVTGGKNQLPDNEQTRTRRHCLLKSCAIGPDVTGVDRIRAAQYGSQNIHINASLHVRRARWPRNLVHMIAILLSSAAK